MKLFSSLRKRMSKNILKNQSGQGATEYILLLVVIVGLVMMFGPKIKTAISGKVSDLEAGMGKVTTDP